MMPWKLFAHYFPGANTYYTYMNNPFDVMPGYKMFIDSLNSNHDDFYTKKQICIILTRENTYFTINSLPKTNRHNNFKQIKYS